VPIDIKNPTAAARSAATLRLTLLAAWGRLIPACPQTTEHKASGGVGMADEHAKPIRGGRRR
jgi:hypothetical protein